MSGHAAAELDLKPRALWLYRTECLYTVFLRLLMSEVILFVEWFLRMLFIPKTITTSTGSGCDP